MVKEYFYGTFGDDPKWFWLDMFFVMLALAFAVGAMGAAGWIINRVVQTLL